jgi:hypothetical protein
MSLSASNIISSNLIALENTVSNQSSQIQKLIDVFQDKNDREYDYVTKQDVSVSFIGGRYCFLVQKPENDVFMYQTWKKNNSEMNKKRKFLSKSLKYWINWFNTKTNYTPTTLIEINNNFYPSVLVEAKIENDNCFFYFDSSQIKENQIQIALGTYESVRFDIDSTTTTGLPVIQNLVSTPTNGGIILSFDIPNILNLLPGADVNSINYSVGSSYYRTEIGYTYANALANNPSRASIFLQLPPGISTVYMYYLILYNGNVVESVLTNNISVTSISPPSPPVNLTGIINYNNNSISLNWNSPLSDNFSPITSYTVYSNNTSYNTPNSYITINNIVNYNFYSFNVLAINAAGPGQSSYIYYKPYVSSGTYSYTDNGEYNGDTFIVKISYNGGSTMNMDISINNSGVSLNLFSGSNEYDINSRKITFTLQGSIYTYGYATFNNDFTKLTWNATQIGPTGPLDSSGSPTGSNSIFEGTDVVIAGLFSS